MTDKDAPWYAHIYYAIDPPGMNQGFARFSKADF